MERRKISAYLSALDTRCKLLGCTPNCLIEFETGDDCLLRFRLRFEMFLVDVVVIEKDGPNLINGD